MNSDKYWRKLCYKRRKNHRIIVIIKARGRESTKKRSTKNVKVWRNNNSWRIIWIMVDEKKTIRVIKIMNALKLNFYIDNAQLKFQNRFFFFFGWILLFKDSFSSIKKSPSTASIERKQISKRIKYWISKWFLENYRIITFIWKLEHEICTWQIGKSIIQWQRLLHKLKHKPKQ